MGIVTIHDIAEHGDTTYIAMDLVEGRTLAEILLEGPLPVAKTIAIATQICDGLSNAQAAGEEMSSSSAAATETWAVGQQTFVLQKSNGSWVITDIQ